ncbi:unnamed protein product [Calypogeia fissa]
MDTQEGTIINYQTEGSSPLARVTHILNPVAKTIFLLKKDKASPLIKTSNQQNERGIERKAIPGHHFLLPCSATVVCRYLHCQREEEQDFLHTVHDKATSEEVAEEEDRLAPLPTRTGPAADGEDWEATGRELPQMVPSLPA